MESKELLQLEEDPKTIFTQQASSAWKNLFQESEALESKIIKPKPEMCVKTKDFTGDKVFINICSSEELPVPKDLTEQQLYEILNSEDVPDFRVPLSLGEPRSEKDKAGNTCTAYDVIVHPNMVKKVNDSQLFLSFLVSVVTDGLEDKYSIELKKTDWIVLRNKKYMGVLQDAQIRCPRKALVTEVDKSKASPSVPEAKKQEKPLITPHEEPLLTPIRTKRIGPSTECIKSTKSLPEFCIKHREGNLMAEVKLPHVSDASSITVDVGVDRLYVSDTNQHELDTYLPVQIANDKSEATFSKKSKVLTVQMPVTSAR